MKNILVLTIASFSLAVTLFGCAPPDKTDGYDSGKTATDSKATATMEKCADCGHEMAATDMMTVDGKMMCTACAESHGANATGDMVDCPCGTQVAKADAKEVDGKLVCADCATKMAPVDGG